MVPLAPDIDMQRFLGRMAVVLDGVLDQQLQAGGRDAAVGDAHIVLYVDDDGFAVSHLDQVKVGIQKGNLLADGHFVALHVLDDVAINLRKVGEELSRQHAILLDQFSQNAEIVEHEMGVDLRFQRIELRLQRHLLLLEQRNFQPPFLVLGVHVGLQIESIGVDARDERGDHAVRVDALHTEQFVASVAPYRVAQDGHRVGHRIVEQKEDADHKQKAHIGTVAHRQNPQNGAAVKQRKPDEEYAHAEIDRHLGDGELSRSVPDLIVYNQPQRRVKRIADERQPYDILLVEYRFCCIHLCKDIVFVQSTEIRRTQTHEK